MPSQDLAQFSGPPRSAIWPGGALHLRCSAFSRALPDLHAHFAVQLSVGFTGDLSLQCGRRDEPHPAAGWLIPSEQPHWISGDGTGVTLFWDPVSSAGRLVRTRLGTGGIVPLCAEECDDIRGELKRCWQRGWRSSDLRTAAARIVDVVARPGVSIAPIDRRVQIVLGLLQRDPAGKSSLPELARLTRLSESRLAHLFRRDVGIPVRQYRLTLRMEQAVQAIAAGRSFTWAAYAAGFADPAHFCRICRRMFGIAPSQLPAFQMEM